VTVHECIISYYSSRTYTVLAERRILYVKMAVHEVTTGLQRVNQIEFESFRIIDGSIGIFEEVHWNSDILRSVRSVLLGATLKSGFRRQ